MPSAKSTSQPSLAQRFARLQKSSTGYSLAQLRELPLDTLGSMTVNFGKNMAGKSYQQAVEEAPDWTSWVLSHLGTSQKPEHQAFILYVERYTAQGETAEAAVTSNQPNSPRVALEPAGSEAPTAESWDMVIESQTAALQHQVSDLQDRIGRLELMLEQVLQHLPATA